VSVLPPIYKRCHEALNLRLRTFAGASFARYCRPVTIVFLLTEHCNARCVHCDIWKNSGKEDSPSIEQLRECLSDLRRWLGPVSVTFTGGEALLKPYTIDLVAYATSLGLAVEVLTNGFWSDQGKIEQLAMAGPARVTLSLDGVGKTHDQIRGRENFFGKTVATIDTLRNIRSQQHLEFSILLKTVIMEHNLGELSSIARFAAEKQAEVLYQPIEQNYNTTEDPDWFTRSENWPCDIARATAAVHQITELKRQGLPIANSYENLRVIVEYFERPAALRVAVQSHVAPGRVSICSAITSFQVQANGDVKVCARRPPIGNIKNTNIREIWKSRPALWQSGCCRREEV
jgi:MoaA/NifB/PqqE/SkfB family radical SAM enzyme